MVVLIHDDRVYFEKNEVILEDNKRLLNWKSLTDEWDIKLSSRLINMQPMIKSFENDLKITPPDPLEKLMLECNIPLQKLDQIRNTLQKIELYIESQNIQGDANVDILYDPEFLDWKMLTIDVFLDVELEVIFDKFKTPIYDIVMSELSEDMIEKITVKVDKVR